MCRNRSRRHRRQWAIASFVGAILCAVSSAQTFRDLTTYRNKPSQFAEVFQVRAGVLGGVVGDKNPAAGLNDKIGWDGHIYYRNDRFAEREALLEAYAGRDGAVINLIEGALAADGQSRLELTSRYFQFFREGFYRDGDFIATGRYEGSDYGVGLYVGREIAPELRIEFGGFYRRNEFDRNETTAANFEIPDNYNAYGGRVFLEQSTLQLNRLTGRPADGFIMTVVGEREQNDSDSRWGVDGVWETRLPDGLWRARAQLEYYLPASESSAWAIKVKASISDRDDRVNNYDAYQPLGDLWVEGRVGYQIEWGPEFVITPYALGQYLRVPKENGLTSDAEFFFGGGVDMALDFGDSLGLVAEYSYLSNESRAPISTSEDTFGEHQFFAGFQARFGSRRR